MDTPYRTRTIESIGPYRGGSWKILFKHPEDIQGPHSPKPLVNTLIARSLAERYELDTDSLFQATVVQITAYNVTVKVRHIARAATGMHARDLLTFLQPTELLGASGSTSTHSASRFWDADADEIIAAAWIPFLIAHPPRTVQGCQRVTVLTKRFYYLQVIFEPALVVYDLLAYGTRISVQDFCCRAEKRFRRDPRVQITDNLDGTSHAVLDDASVSQALLGDVDRDIETTTVLGDGPREF